MHLVCGVGCKDIVIYMFFIIKNINKYMNMLYNYRCYFGSITALKWK